MGPELLGGRLEWRVRAAKRSVQPALRVRSASLPVLLTTPKSEPMTLTIGTLNELDPTERRVALVPATVGDFVKDGRAVLVQAGAGVAAGHADADYVAVGAEVLSGAAEIIERCQVMVQVRALGAVGGPEGVQPSLERLRKGQVLLASCAPLDVPEGLAAAASAGIDVFALELVPRTTRAQGMDVLSSMATLAGYKAALLAATELPRLFPMMMTAAGTIPAARVFVLGAGVAGLQAMATAKRLGAVVEGYDIRPAVKDQVQSVGARFVELDLETGDAEGKGGYAKEQGEEFLVKQRALLGEVLKRSDAVITTAAIPGRPSPELVTEEMLSGMKSGSVLIDLAAERGGNCRSTLAGGVVVVHGVTLHGPLELAGSIPKDASQMLSRNALNFLRNAYKEGADVLDLEDDIVLGTMATRGGEVVHPRLCDALEVGAPAG